MQARSSAICAAIATLCASADAQPLAVVVRNTVNLPASTTDQNAAMFTIAGLSGVTYRAAAGTPGTGGEFVAVMDNSNKLVRLSISFNADASIASATVAGGISLAETRDFEGVAYTDAGANTVFLAEEGVPSVREFSLADGALLRTLAAPAVFTGRRDNFGFESMAQSRRNGELWTANEEALTVDGPASTPSAGTTVRLLRFTPGNLAAAQQYAYTTEPMHGSVISGARSGVSDLVVLPSGRMIALERSFAFSAAGFFQTRIYELDFSGATDVSGLASLTGQTYTPVAKRLLWSGNLNNLEGLCLGPRIGPGHYVLVGIVDDGDPISVNAITSFDLTGDVACPADINDDGLVSVQDIFDFLALYFTNAPGADINSSGAVTVQDIFDFLAAFFSGC